MAIFIIYIIRWAVVFTLLYSLFRLFMKRETLHGVNRMVLLFVLAASMILPLCQIETTRANIVTKSREMIEHHIQNDQNPSGDDVKNVTIINPDNEMSYTPVPIHEDTNVYILLAVAVYLLGLILFWLHYFWQLGSLLLLINRGKCIEIEGLPKQIRVLTNPEVKNPCCWMRWIILNPKDANSRLILQHEMAHLHLGHSWDMLLCELTCRMLWFLPFSWMLRQDLRDIHEYQADRRVLDRADAELAEEYQQLLIRRATSEEGRSEIYTTPHVESSLHQSPIKRRFKMMYQRPSTRWAMLKAAYLLPLCIFALVAFARPQAMNEIETEVKKAESDFVASMQSPGETGNNDSNGSSVQNYSYSNDERNIEEEVTNAISTCYDVVFDWYNKQRDTLHVEHHFDEVYLTKEFYDLQEEARRISWEIDDIGPFDCDHWIQAQDWSVMDYSIDSVNVLSNDSADVYMMLRNGNERTPVLLKVAYATNHRIPSSKQWLVNDFISKGWEGKQYSEKQILHDYIEEYPQDSIMAHYEANIRWRIKEIYGKIIDFCQESKKQGLVRSLQVFNTQDNLSEDYFKLYSIIVSIDAPKDGCDHFFFNRPHWQLALDVDGISEIEILSVKVKKEPSMPKAEADVMLRLTCESYYLWRETSVSHFNSHLRMVHERGSWFIDDFINVRGIDGSEKRQMKLHIENQGKY